MCRCEVNILCGDLHVCAEINLVGRNKYLDAKLLLSEVSYGPKRFLQVRNDVYMRSQSFLT